MKVIPDFSEMLSRLVGEPSISSTSSEIDRSNLGVIEQLATWLEDLGFDAEIMPLPGRPDKANLIATLGTPPQDNEGGLVLAGHTDTVPFDDSLWQSDPFRLKDAEDRFYGLGCCDMKGFFPVALMAARSLDADTLTAPLTLIATADEESSMAGGRQLLASGRPRAKYAVIGEPTGMRPIFAHKGISMMSIKIEGASGHSSDPSLGANALDAMHEVITALIALRTRLAQQYRDDAFEVSIPTMNLGCLHGGDNPNRICGSAELQIDLRLLPGMNSDSLHDELEALIHQAVAQHDVTLNLHKAYPPILPFASPADGELVTTLGQLSRQEPGTVAFGTEAHFLQSLGMETVVWGPGHIDQAHQPNEYLHKGQIEPAIDTLEHIIHRYCVA
tara:strand:+ start:11679 stop:12842 length:1164 start_codon:yes stop_codon:yes gene_type:complete